MHNPISTHGLDANALKELWSLGGEGHRVETLVDADQLKVERLVDALAQKIPLEQALMQMLPEVFARVCASIRPFTGSSFQDLLCNPATDIGTLKQMKDYFKRLAKSEQDQVDRDVVAVLYYASIASALVHHNERISSFPGVHLSNKLSTYLGYSWLTPPVKGLFQEALKLCGDLT